MISGIINVNKPEGITSFQVVSLIKKKLGIKRVGHLGTLDPAGCGVLPIAVNKATKLFDYYLNKRKTYRAIFYFGKETDTLDSFGKVINTYDKIINMADLIDECHKMCGIQEQMPPKYSAKSINGIRAYELARSNVEFELKPKKVEIFNFKVVEKLKTNLYLFEIECSAGCYIRSICRDLAKRLGTVAYMPLIIRVKAGDFAIDSSVDYCELQKSENIESYINDIACCLKLDKITFNEVNTKKLKSGQCLYFNIADGNYLLLDNNNQAFALGRVENNSLKMERYLGD